MVRTRHCEYPHRYITISRAYHARSFARSFFEGAGKQYILEYKALREVEKENSRALAAKGELPEEVCLFWCRLRSC